MSELDQPRAESAADAGDAETAYLLNYLATHDAACPLCKYNLRGLTVPRCPECGREIRLAVGMKEPYLRALVTTLVALCISAGCGIPSLAVLADGLLRTGHHTTFKPGAIFLFCATIFSM